jgi:hypothetical protein
MNVSLKSTKQKLNTVRIEERAIKDAFDGPLGEETKAVTPNDIEVMFLGRMCSMALDFQTRMKNTISGMTRAYGEIDPYMEAKLKAHVEAYTKDFEQGKLRAIRVLKDHPLALKLCPIKGFTEYQLGLLMSHIKDITRFSTPSALCTYAGVVPKYGKHISKKTLTEIRGQKHEEYMGDPDDFTEFGYNTKLQQRMYILIESLMRANGWFYDFYAKTRIRLTQRALNGGETFIPTDEEVKASKGAMKKGEHYIVGKKHQSLIMWSHRNAFWRVGRVFLHMLYEAWCEVEGITGRPPYPIEYLGHTRLFTLKEVLDFETAQAAKRKAEKALRKMEAADDGDFSDLDMPEGFDIAA